MEKLSDRTTDKETFGAKVIPSRGAWLEFEIDKRDAVDSCVELARLGSDGFSGGDVRFEERDLIGMLLEDPISPFSCEDAYDLAVCFGFMHHAPGFENRLRLLEARTSPRRSLPDASRASWPQEGAGVPSIAIRPSSMKTTRSNG